MSLTAATLISLSGALAISPAASVAATTGTVASVLISPHTVIGGTPAQGTVTLEAAVDSPTVVDLSSTDTSVLTVAATVTVPAGDTTATFAVTTFAFTGDGRFACVDATAGGGTAASCLNVNPGPSGPALTSVTFSPGSVAGGGGVTGTVTFADAPDGGRVVSLVSSNPAVASVPDEALVLSGSSSGVFAVTTAPVTVATTVTVTATADGTSVSGTLSITPGTPVTDTVRVTRASWDRGLLRIEATSSNPDAILSVFGDPSDPTSFMFNLTNEGSGRYSAEREWIFNPEQITVVSNFGGSDTANT